MYKSVMCHLNSTSFLLNSLALEGTCPIIKAHTDLLMKLILQASANIIVTNVHHACVYMLLCRD